jgi:uncharacterized membrane-anchored protein
MNSPSTKPPAPGVGVNSAVNPVTGSAVFSKVPEATALFWIIKVLTTGMGEVVADAFMEWTIVGAVIGAGALLVAALVWQFRSTRYRAWPYWTAVAMVSVFGTMVADGIRRGLGFSFVTTTIIFAIAVALSLGLWYRSERTLSIHSITTRKREIFYWCTVMATFALGTALGDMTASTLGWGFMDSGLLYIGLILLPAVAYRFLGLNGVVAFWASYIVTRPLGASFADWAWVPHPWGAGLGKELTSIITVVAFLIAVVWAARTRNGEPKSVVATA